MKYKVLIFCCLAFTSLQAGASKYSLPEEHVLQKPLAELFQNLSPFESRKSLEQAGFKVLKHHGIVVVRHPTIEGYLIKLFVSNLTREEQKEHFTMRIKGALRLQKFIKKYQIDHVVTPEKWLYTLKKNDLGISCVLIAKDMDIVSKSESRRRYEAITPIALKELCVVLKAFRGLDSILNNMPFTQDGKIALIDTEKWQIEKPIFLKHITPLLDSDRLKIVSRYDVSLS